MKIEGKETPDETTDSTTPEVGSLDVQGILEFARGNGCSLNRMEERPDFPLGVLAAWQRGINSRASMGLHQFSGEYWNNLYSIYESGLRYSRRQQQDELPEETTADAEPTGPVTDDVLDRFITYTGRLTGTAVGGATRDTQSGPEPEGNEFERSMQTLREYYYQNVRSTSRGEEGRVSGLRIERSGSEPEQEDTW